MKREIRLKLGLNAHNKQTSKQEASMTKCSPLSNSRFLKCESHNQPVTRRSLMAHGLLGSVGTALVPSFLSLLWEKQAFGLTCSDASTGTELPAFIVLDLVGGANIAGNNVLVGKNNNQEDFLGSYATLGIPNALSPKTLAAKVDRTMGLAWHSDSAMLAGIKSKALPATLANCEGAVFATISGDDTSTNVHNPTFWINKAGLKGKYASLVGTRSTNSGGSATAPPASYNPAARPSVITKASDALGLIKAGKLSTLFPQDVSKILEATRSMSVSRLAAFQQKDLNDEVKELIECGYVKSQGMLVATQAEQAAINPAVDTTINTLFTGFTRAEDQAASAAVAKLVLDGFAGAGTIALADFDYHNANARSVTDARDRDAGVVIGSLLQAAALKKRDLMIYVYTDGGVGSSGAPDPTTGKGVYNADAGQNSAAFTIVYKANAKPGLRRTGVRQVGAFNDAGSVDSRFNLISNSVENLTKAVVANYMALLGKEGDLASIVGDNPFGSSLEKYLIFSKLK